MMISSIIMVYIQVLTKYSDKIHSKQLEEMPYFSSLMKMLMQMKSKTMEMFSA